MWSLVCSFLQILLQVSPENRHTIMYDIVAMLVAIDAGTAETTAYMLFCIVFLALCSCLGCYIICVLLFSYVSCPN